MPQRFVRGGVIYKECPGCAEVKPHDGDHYYRSGKHKDGSLKYYTRCKPCSKAANKQARGDRGPEARERHKRRLRARQRAWAELGRRHPAEMQSLYEEELAHEFMQHGPMPRAEAKR